MIHSFIVFSHENYKWHFIFLKWNCLFNINDISFSLSVKQIPFPSGTPLKTDSTVSENEMQSIPVTTISSGAKEQVKGGGEEEKKMKEKAEKKGTF